MLEMDHVAKIKFCGITNAEDAAHAVHAGAWAIGMVMWPGSPRRCELGAATEIAAAHHRHVQVVGVFVNPTLDELIRTADAVEFTILQLHGDEGPAFCAEAARRTGCRIIKAARVRSKADIQALAAFHTDHHLLDSYVAGVPGGSGATFAWDLAAAHAGGVPLILSGGLNPDNVAQAISVVNPYAVDVASGVEASPGHKDPAKLEAFANAVAGAHAPLPAGPHAARRRSAHAPTGTPS
jgi:phosphoribosylanthranilate isomerase